MDIKEIFKIAIKKNASDIHLVDGLSPILRIDGKLITINSFSDHHYDDIDSGDMHQIINLLLNEKQKKKFLQEKDLDFSHDVGTARLRVNLSFEKGHIKLVARIINDKLPTMEDILIPKSFYKLLEQKQGLILVTGPTGCGKSTTLAAMIDYINENHNSNIITLEDPIEFVFESKKSVITQRQLHDDMPSFSNGLRHILRQDPNVIMVGEMRDLETISSAVTLAETGHLVLATLHTYDSVQTIDRIIDIFPPHQQGQIRSQLSMILSAVISQRLLPKIGGGRIAAREIMIRNSAISNLIRESKIPQIKSVITTSSQEGMFSLGQNIKELYKKGVIEKEDAKRYLDNNDDLE